ncbi:MAG: FkbM family methyltransferase [Psychroserpens sp.]|jgi:FkbM family methyltransferase
MNKILSKLGYTIYKNSFHERKYKLKSEFHPLNDLLYKYLHKDFFFVQIGANDGIIYDQIFPFVTAENVKGIALEPIQDIYKILVKNYEKYPNVKLINKGIHISEKIMPIYRVNQSLEKYPEWTKGTSSFNKSHHELSGILEEDIISEMVTCLTFDELSETENILNIDLLQIDTEGYDFEIINSINFDKIKPKLINFEHGLGSGIMSFEEFNNIHQILYRHEYKIITLENDTIAYLD